MADLQLAETRHPDKGAQAAFDSLIGIDDHKRDLIDHLTMVLDPSRIERWRKAHHPGGLALVSQLKAGVPLVLLSGEVGCGKTALARTVATPLAKNLDTRVNVFETPSDVRGRGLVGELSSRITEAFEQAKRRLGKAPGILLIDEADDLATRRSQSQAHHEDRAGLNVLVKELDALGRADLRLAVVLITNRADVLDPAIRRRAGLHLTFERPTEAARRALFERMLDGCEHAEADLKKLVKASAKSPPYSYGDLVERVGRRALTMAIQSDQAFGPGALLQALAVTEASPLLQAE